jgi:hypothetical protein
MPEYWRQAWEVAQDPGTHGLFIVLLIWFWRLESIGRKLDRLELALAKRGVLVEEPRGLLELAGLRGRRRR